MKTILYLFLLFCILQSCTTGEREIDQVVETQNGAVIGTYDETAGVYAFKGIPFARAPVDSLRWRPPLPVDSWEDTLDATSFGAICMQGDPAPFSMWTREFIAPAGNMSEDCLNLNVWTAGGPVDEGRPVMVFIHGGGFGSGSGSVPVYDGTNMARKGVVFVTINYRVGVMGFMAHPELTEESPDNSSGNYGLLDQIAALQWVQQNIEAFGGDPGNVTIAGQSAGAYSVNYLVASPLAEGLFHRAIGESGGVILTTVNGLEDAEMNGEQIAQRLNVGSLSGLRQLPADSLQAMSGGFSPNIDGYLLPEPVYDLFMSGTYNDVPLLTGWNADEGFSFGSPEDAEAFRNTIREQFGSYADELLRLFPADNDSLVEVSREELGSLRTFGVQSWKWMKLQNETGSSPVYLYHFTRDLPYIGTQQDYGAFHTGEVPYAYNTLHTSDRPWQDVDYELADRMSSYWVNFARNGDPNGEGLPQWNLGQADEYETMYLGDTVESGTVPSREKLELLDEIITSQLEE